MRKISIAMLCLAGSLSTPPAPAGSVGRETMSMKGAKQAPTIEDYADYFRGTTISADLKKEAEADKLRLKSIAAINEMLGKEKDKGARQFELMLRLGELYVERHDFMREVEIEKFKRDFEAWEKAPEGKPQPAISHEMSKKELNKAANSFRNLATAYPKHPRTATVLFVLGKTLSRLNLDSAVLYYEKLLKDHPKSELVPDAHLALGEHYFEKHDIEKALECYKKAMAFKDHKAYPYAVYKLGWAYYNRDSKDQGGSSDNLEKSVSAFKLVIRLSDKAKKTGKETGLDLREEAIKDLIMVWADAEDINSAWAYFKTIGEKDSFYMMLERLGGIYTTQGKNEQAIAVYTRLLKEAPLRESNPDVHLKLVELYDLTNKPSMAYAELENISKAYLGSTEWTKAFPAAKEETAGKVERNTHRYGALYHNRGIKAKSNDYLKVSARIYALYLDKFPKTEASYEIRFYLAEIMHEFQQFDAAATQYLMVSKQQPTGGKYSKESATAAVAAMNSLVNSKTYPKLPPPGQVAQPMPVPPEKMKLVEALDNYVKTFGADKDSNPMRITAAKMLFDYGHYDKAMPRFIKITDELPATIQAEAAGQTVIAFYSEESDWKNVVKTCQHFEKNTELMKQPKIGEQINTAYRAAAFNIALALENEKKHKESAEAFVAFQAKFANDKNAERSLYNASLNFYKAGEVKRAIEVQTMLLKTYPSSELKPDVLASLGETHEALVQFKAAAGFYLDLGTQFPQDKRAPAALLNAGVIFRGIDDLVMADRALSTFVRAFPAHEIYPEALMELAEVKEKQQALAEAKSYYSQYAAKYAATKPEEATTAQAKAALISKKIGSSGGGKGAAKEPTMDDVSRKLAQNQDMGAFEARQIAAREQFDGLAAPVAAFKTRELNAAKLEESIKAMQDELVKLTDGYERVMSLGSGEYVVASLYKMGELHEMFAEKLLKAPMTTNANPTEVNQIQSALEGLAFPLKEEAYKFYETAYKRSAEVETFTDWTRLTYEKMSDLQPAQHPDIDALIIKPSYMTHKVAVKTAEAE